MRKRRLVAETWEIRWERPVGSGHFTKKPYIVYTDREEAHNFKKNWTIAGRIQIIHVRRYKVLR